MRRLTFGIVLANVLAVVMIVLIIVYLVNDRRRFQIERQFRAVREPFDEWAGLAGAVDGCGETAAAYREAKSVSEKYRLLALLYGQSRLNRSMRMRQLEAELAPFCSVYNGMAESFNRRLVGRASGPVMRLLGFRPLPALPFEPEEF